MKNESGFTLIETIMYIALFSIIMGGALATAFNVFESNDRSRTISFVQAEGQFLTAKIEWALGDAASIALPPAESSGISLFLTKYDGSEIRIYSSGTNIEFQRGSNPPQVLNRESAEVSNLNFIHSWSGGNNPERVETNFTVSVNTSSGVKISQDFSVVKYVRK